MSENSTIFTYNTDIIKDELIDRIKFINKNTIKGEIDSLFNDIISFIYVDDFNDNVTIGQINHEELLINYFKKIFEITNKKINKLYYLDLFKNTDFYNDLNKFKDEEGIILLNKIENRILESIDSFNGLTLTQENLPNSQLVIDNDGNYVQIPITDFEKMNISERDELYKNDRNTYNKLFDDMIQNKINYNAANISVNNNGSISSITRTDAIKTNQNTPITSPEKNDFTYEDIIRIHYPAEPPNKKRTDSLFLENVFTILQIFLIMSF